MPERGAADDRSGADGVGGQTAVRGDAHAAPHRLRPMRRCADRGWWCAAPARHHLRRWVLDVARPVSGADGDVAGRVVVTVVDQDPPSTSGNRTARRHVPPRFTSTPVPVSRWTSRAHRSAATALAVAPRSSSVPGGRHVAAVELHGGPVDGHGDRGQSRGGGPFLQVAVIAQLYDRVTDGGVDVAVTHPRRFESCPDKVGQNLADRLGSLSRQPGRRSPSRSGTAMRPSRRRPVRHRRAHGRPADSRHR